MTTTAQTSSLELATQYVGRGFSIVPILRGEKGPKVAGWQKMRLTAGDLGQYFKGEKNVGALLGLPFGAGVLGDVDLDCPEALLIAPSVLPPTPCIFGRPSKPASHHFYTVTGNTTSKRYTDPSRPKDQACIIELRASPGHQTVLPGSLHKSGELIEFSSDGVPATIDATTLHTGVAHIASAVLLGRHWPGEGSRQDTAMALSGALLRHGWTVEQASAFLSHVLLVARDDEEMLRLGAIATTKKKLDDDQPVTGIPHLRKLIPALGVVDEAVKWLDLKAEPEQTYRVDGGRTVWMRPTRDGDTIPTPIADWTGIITHDRIEDDATEITHSLTVEVTAQDGSKQIVHIPSTEFDQMTWPTARLGSRGFIYPGQGIRDHVRAAIYLRSKGSIQDQRVFTHTGWRRLGGEWLYLHGGGAIGKDGNRTDISVDLGQSPRLLPFELPDPGGADAVRASLRLLDVADDVVSVPLFLSTYLAPLGNTNFTLYMSGQPERGKSAISALSQQHYGAAFADPIDIRAPRMPGSFGDTAYANMEMMFYAKDAIFVVDDFTKDGGDPQKKMAEFAQVVRAQGNYQGRNRLSSDITTRPAHPPRGLLVASGEFLPNSGRGIHARMYTIHLPKPVQWPVVSECQEYAARGTFAAAMAAYLKWLAPQLDDVQKARQREVSKFTAEKRGDRNRDATVAASFLFTADLFLRFATEIGAISDPQATALRTRFQAAFTLDAETQEIREVEQDPVLRYIEAIKSGLAARQFYIEDRKNPLPIDSPRITRIGWREGDDIYLFPSVVFNEVQKAAGDERYAMNATSMSQYMAEYKLLKTTDEGRHTKRMSFEGGRPRVLHLAASTLGLGGDENDN